MKTCSKCKLTLDKSEFYKSANTGDGLQLRCKECSKNRAREGYKERKSQGIDSTAEITKLKKRLVVQIMNEYKRTKGCCFCGQNVSCCLDFHHKDPSIKEYNVSRLISSKSIKKIVEEVKKCLLVCANCHRQIHDGLLDTKDKDTCSDLTLDMFDSVQSSAKDHKNNVAKKLATKEKFRCSCGKVIDRESIRCVKCHAEHNSSDKWPSNEELQAMLLEKPAAQIAKELDIADTAIVKRCRKYGISKPPRGYWQKKAAGKL